MIKLFEQFNEYSQVKSWLDDMGIKNYTINDDLTVDVDGDVRIGQKEDMTELPIQFRKVYGSFFVVECGLTTLKGGPSYVAKNYNVSFNKITSLKYAPKEMGWAFSTYENPLPKELDRFRESYSINTILKHQEEYGIWNSDGSFNKERWNIFLQDCKNNIIDTE